MNCLIVDSSTKNLYISIIYDNKLVFEKYIAGKNDHAKNIVATIDEGLKENNMTVDCLDRVICGIGPGSYTGVRMAVTVCKMISSFKKIDLYTISTLKLISSGYSGICKVMIDARRNNAFAMVFDYNKSQYVLKEGLYSYDELSSYEADCIITDDDIKVDAFFCMNNSILCQNPDLLVPNYLRETEAERNLK